MGPTGVDDSTWKTLPHSVSSGYRHLIYLRGYYRGPQEERHWSTID